MFLFNTTGSDIRIYSLDEKARRTGHGTIADNMSSSILTSVGSPWVITDRAGQCLQIVLPGERTRSLASRRRPRSACPARVNRPQRTSGRQRGGAAPVHPRHRPGSADYEHMTPAVAAWTRSQIAVLAGHPRKAWAAASPVIPRRLGTCSDIYMAHFANGTAEWRISLTRHARSRAIALGPQY